MPRHPLILTTVLLTGCATVDPGPDFARAADEIRASTGASEVFDPEAALLSPEELEAALADGLTLAETTRLALLNNRRLQAGFFALGVARAEFVQSGLLRNPELGLAVLLPDGAGRARWTADLLVGILELWEIPARRRAADRGVEQRTFELVQLASELVQRTRAAYHRTVAARALIDLARQEADLAARARDAVVRQIEEGVAIRTDGTRAENRALAARLAVTGAERDELRSARDLAALLSIEEDLLEVPLVDPLPDPAPAALERETLVALGLQQRQDLRAAEAAVAAAEERVTLERRRRTPQLSAGLSAERPEGDASADLFLGPAATVEVPLFDRNQAQVSRAELELSGLRREHEALVFEVAQELRAASDRARVAARAAMVAIRELVPEAERGEVLARRAHELGDTLVLDLLDAQRVAIEARRTAVEALLESALARDELERALGAPLGAP